MSNNMKLRSSILEYSLILEDSLDKILQFNLGIFDGGVKTKLFGLKASLSFKTKIDFLHDLNVLSKDETLDLELFMNFRNKFIHDVNSTSFLNVLEQLDNGIKNRFKTHLNKGGTISNEDDCKAACLNLQIKNLNVIQTKIAEKRERIKEINEIFQLQIKCTNFHIDLYFDLVKDTLLLFEESNLENNEVRILTEQISERFKHYSNKMQKDPELTSYKAKLDAFSKDRKKTNNFFGVTRNPDDLI